VLVVGAEQMTTTPGPEIGKNLLRASYLPEDGDTPAGFAGVFGKIATPISSATATSPTRWP
jgi:acetyl-CoA C-acetyltransferase